MTTRNNVIALDNFRRESQQDIIDDIGARAFMFLREEAQRLDVPTRDVLIEHLYGLAMVIKAVEGEEAAQGILAQIAEQLTQR